MPTNFQTLQTLKNSVVELAKTLELCVNELVTIENPSLFLDSPPPKYWLGDRVALISETLGTLGIENPDKLLEFTDVVNTGSVIGLAWDKNWYCSRITNSKKFWWYLIEFDEDKEEPQSYCEEDPNFKIVFETDLIIYKKGLVITNNLDRKK